MENDVSKKELQEKEIIDNYLNILEVLNQTTGDFLFLINLKTDTIWYFGNINEKYALRENGTVTNTLDDVMKIVYPADRHALSKDFEDIAQSKKDVHNMDYRWITRNGQMVWINCRGKVIKDSDGKPFIMVGRVSESALKHMYNGLTGLFNQIKLMSDLKEELENKSQGYLMMIDIDELSAINLSRGRAYGDELLKTMARNLEEIAADGRVYHTERNSFVVYLNTYSEQEVRNVYEKTRDAMRDKCSITAGAVPVARSVFIDESKLYDSAKITLRKAKDKGKNNLEFFAIEEIHRKISSVELLDELQESVDNNFRGFYINYQPQVRAGSYNLYSAEALIRYNSKSGRQIYPDEFIPLLEQSKLIIPVGLWVLENALLQCKEWRKHIENMRISVNFSMVQFMDKYVVERVLGTLKKTGMSGDALTIEITESISMYEIKDLSNIISHLKAAGIQIAIDDYGTGYASMGYLKQLDVDEIKIDRMFVQGIEEGTYNYKIISNTLDFAKMNSIRVCCEGVETARELTILESCSPDLIQGYLFDKPCEVEMLEAAYMDAESDEYKKRTDFINDLYAHKERERIIQFDPRDILRETNVGLWVIRINEEKQCYEMHTDETMERIMGIDKKYTPQECYDFWFSRIKEEYVDYVQKNTQLMVESNKTLQLEYPWIHPTLGEVNVRCSGKRVADSDGMAVLEGYHRFMIDIEEV